MTNGAKTTDRQVALGESTDETLKSAVVLIHCLQHLNQDQFTKAKQALLLSQPICVRGQIQSCLVKAFGSPVKAGLVTMMVSVRINRQASQKMRPVYRTILQKCQSTAHTFLQNKLLWLVAVINSNLSPRVGKLSSCSLRSLKQDRSATRSQRAFTRSPAPAGGNRHLKNVSLAFFSVKSTSLFAKIQVGSS